MPTNETPTTASVRNRYIYITRPDSAITSTAWELSRAEAFDRWFAAESARLRAEGAAEATGEIITAIRRHCTPSTEAYSQGGDALVRAVADWIENPPAWLHAGWTGQSVTHCWWDFDDGDREWLEHDFSGDYDVCINCGLIVTPEPNESI